MGILALAADERIVGVKFTKDALSASLRDGRTIRGEDLITSPE